MKSILMSIKPEYVAEILNHRKTLEIRKTAPKCDLPVEVYIYCAKSNKYPWYLQKRYDHSTDETLGRSTPYYVYEEVGEIMTPELDGKVVAKFTLKSVGKIKYHFGYYDMGEWTESHILEESCLSYDELDDYLQASKDYDESKPSPVYGYGWHIEDLEIFDRPRELCEFHTNVKKEPPEESLCPECGKPMEYYEYKYLKEAPRSWQYIEVE